MARSLKSHLALSILIALGGLFLVSAVLIRGMATAWVQERFDEALEAKAWALVTLTKQRAGHVELDFADELMPEFEAEVGAQYFEIWLSDESLLERSRSLAGADLPRRLPSPFVGGTSVPQFSDHRLPDGRSGRLIQIDFWPQVEGPGKEEAGAEPLPAVAQTEETIGATLVLGRSRELLDRQLARLEQVILIGGFGLALAAACLVWVALGRGLRPLEDIRRQIDGLNERRLDRRISLDNPRAELVPVVEELNRLLEGLHQAFERERRLSSHLAHELRTPIAELRSLSEVGCLWPEEPEAARTFYTFANGIALQMENIVSHLLALARCDGGLEELQLESVDVGDLFRRLWRPLAATADSRGLRLQLEIADRCLVTDLVKMEMILSNLLSNAVAYAPQGSQICCRLRWQGSRFSLKMENPAPHLEAENLESLFDRFWCKETPTSGGRHLGLGLALVQALAQLLGLEIFTSLNAGSILSISLSGEEPRAREDGSPVEGDKE